MEKKDEWATLSVRRREELSGSVGEISPDLLGFSASKKAGIVGSKNGLVPGRSKASASGFSLFFSFTENQRRGLEVASRSLEGSKRFGVDKNGSKADCGTVVRKVARC